MNQDNNKNRSNSRPQGSLEVPKPRAIAPGDAKNEFQDDLAIDSMLHELGQSSFDGQEFFGRVNSRRLSPQSASSAASDELPVEPGESDSFFGLPPTLERGESQAKQQAGNQASLFSTRSKFLAIAASVTFLAISSAWWFFGAPATSDGPSATNSGFAKPDQSNGELNGSSPSAFTPDDPRLTKSPLVNPSVIKPIVPVEGGADEAEPSAQNLADSSVASSTEKEIAVPLEANRSDGVWKLVINLDEKGEAELVVNETKLQGHFPASVANMVLGRISHEVSRRVHFLSPALSEDWDGLIELNGPGISKRLDFDGVDEMHNVIVQMRETIAGMDLKVLKKKSGIPTVDQIKFWSSRDMDIPIVMEAIAETDRMLRSNLSATYFGKGSNSNRFKNYRVIGEAEFSDYMLTGSLEIPSPLESFSTEGTFQVLEPETLKQQLKSSVAEVDMFRDRKEFTQTFGQILSASEAGLVAKNAGKEVVRLTQQMEVLEKRIKEIDSPEIRKSSAGRTQMRMAKKALGKASRELLKFQDLASLHDDGSSLEPLEPLTALLAQRPDLQGLNLVMGEACHLEEGAARTLDVVSKSTGRTLQQFDRFGTRDFSKHDEMRLKTIRSLIRKSASSPNTAQAIGTLDQMLQIEEPELRLELVNALSQTSSKTGCVLLTCYAKYDVDSKVRQAATDALRGYPADLYRDKLLEGFLYPWPEVAKHTAEAIVRLNDTESIPTLVKLLNSPDPRTPQSIEEGKFVQRELVGINHMRNCTLCHADSQSESDQGRGLIPVWGTALVRQYYHGSGRGSAMIRADVTYLRQDFSLIQPVEDAAPWPENQRFDYVVRRTVLDQSKAREICDELGRQPNQYHKAIDKALRLLTDKNPADDSYETWQKIVSDVPQ